MEAAHHISEDSCEQCGLCAQVCPNGVVVSDHEGRCGFQENRIGLCIGCAHCTAVCPTQSVHVPGLSYERDLFDLPETGVDGEAFTSFVSTRRAVRLYRRKPVPRESLDRIVRAISLAPMGFPPHKVAVTVVESRGVIEEGLPLMVSFYEKMLSWMGNPVSRFFMRRQMPEETFMTLRNHLAPALRARLPDMKGNREDLIARGAPALILFHAHRASENHTEDAVIALTYGFLAAHALGLGATPISLIPPAVERVPELRTLFRIPEENEVTAAMVTGYPRVRFKRGIRRELAGVTYIP